MKCSKCGQEMVKRKMDGSMYYVCEDCKIRKKIPNQPEYTEVVDTATEKPKSKISKLLLVSLILGVAYLIYSAVYWTGANTSAGDAAEQIGAGLASAMVTPHLIFVVLAVIFNALGCFMKKRAFALTGAILYAVAMVLFPLYFFFVIVQMILSFVGFAKMKKSVK